MHNVCAKCNLIEKAKKIEYEIHFHIQYIKIGKNEFSDSRSQIIDKKLKRLQFEYSNVWSRIILKQFLPSKICELSSSPKLVPLSVKHHDVQC